MPGEKRSMPFGDDITRLGDDVILLGEDIILPGEVAILPGDDSTFCANALLRAAVSRQSGCLAV